MTKNAARKKAVRAYMTAHPDVAYREANQIVSAEHAAAVKAERLDDIADMFKSVTQLLTDAVDGHRALVDHELDLIEDVGRTSFAVTIDGVTVGPVYVMTVDHDLDTVSVDEHEEFEGGTTIGDILVDAEIGWEADVLKADYRGTDHGVPWRVIDLDWGDDHVRVAGTLQAELTYQYVVDEASQAIDALTLEGFEQVLPAPAR